MTEFSQSCDPVRIDRAGAKKIQIFLAELQKSPHPEFASRYCIAIAYTKACGRIYFDTILALIQLAKDSVTHHADVNSRLSEQIKESTKMEFQSGKLSANHDGLILHQLKETAEIVQNRHELENSALYTRMYILDKTLRFVLESSTREEFVKSIPERIGGLVTALDPVCSLIASIWAIVKPPQSILKTKSGSAALTFLDEYIVELNRYAVAATFSNSIELEVEKGIALSKAIEDAQPKVTQLVQSYMPQDLANNQDEAS